MPCQHLNKMEYWYILQVTQNHIGFYPTSSGIKIFKDEIASYKSSKGAIQFPIDKPLPLALIKKIVEFRVKEDAQKAKVKSNKKH